MTSANEPASRPGAPPPQHNLQTATDLAAEALRDQSPEQMSWLGAERAGALWRVPVLEDVLTADLAGGVVRTAAGAETGAPWRILVLHYLALRDRPPRQIPEVTFGDLPAARAYAGVYRQRVNLRLCATAGRDLSILAPAAEALGGRPAEGGDAAFDFDVFPRAAVRLIWHAADEEFGPSATLLLPANIESLFCVEDIVVLSERLVSRLSGGSF